MALERELHEAVEQLPKRTPEAWKTLDYMLVAVKLGIVSSGRSHPAPGRSHASGVRAVRFSPNGDLLTASSDARRKNSTVANGGVVSRSHRGGFEPATGA